MPTRGLRTWALVAALLGASAATAYAQALEIGGGSALRVESVRVGADLDAGVALVDVDQTFRNDGGSVREGTYVFRLPEHAVVHEFSMWIDGREKHGRVLESQRARAIYDSIVQRRRDPALLEEIGFRTFRVSVFPIPAHDSVRIRLVYAYVADDDLGLRELEIPMPQGAAVGVADVTVRVHDAQGVGVLDCPSHAAADVQRDGTLGSVTWNAENVRFDGPFRVRSAPAGQGLTLALVAAREEGAAEGHFLVRLVPRLDDVPAVPRDVVFVIDRSGSMSGRKIEQARAALLHGLATLAPDDRFQVLSFSSGVNALAADGLVAADADALARARQFANGLTASGGTNIDAALRAAVELRTDDPARLFQVVFLTDGDPTVGETLTDRITAGYAAASQGRARLFAFGVGSDVKEFLLSRLAAESRGSAQYVRDGAELEVKVSALFDKVRSPVVTDLELEVVGDAVDVRGLEPERLPDAYRGTAVVAAGSYTGSGDVLLRLRGRVGRHPVELRVPATLPAAAPGRGHVAQLWARLRIDRLLDDLRIHGMNDEIRREIVALGTAWQVVSPYTSFLVVEDGVHVADDGELARVPEGPPPPRTADGGAPSSGGGDTGGPTTGSGDWSRGKGASAAGGSFRGPGGDVPPDSREPTDPPPRPEGGGPTTAGGETGGPTTGAGGAGPSIHTFGTRRSERWDYTHWRFWWDVAAAPELDAQRRLAPPLASDVRDQVVLPALRGVAGDPDAVDDLRAAAIRALGRLGDTDPVTLAQRLAVLRGDGGAAAAPHAVVVAAARAAAAGGELSAAERDALRLLLGATSRHPGQRGAAALALGLGGPDPTGATLDALLLAARDPDAADVAPAAACALGLLGDARAVPELLRVLDERRTDQLVCAWAVDALGRLGVADDAVLDALDERARAPWSRIDVVVARCVPTALARLSRGADAAALLRIRRRLTTLHREARDVSVRDQAALALGRLAAAPDISETARDGARGELDQAFVATRARCDFEALGLGLAACGPDREQALRRLRSVRTPARAIDAQAPALAARVLARDPEALAAYRAVAADPGATRESRCFALDVLAAAGDDAAPGALRASAATVVPYPELEAAYWAALAECGDAAALARLVAFAEADRVDARLARALARCAGDAEARRIAALVAPSRSEDVRLQALDVLGRMADRADTARRLDADFPYRAYVAAIYDWRAE